MKNIQADNTIFSKALKDEPALAFISKLIKKIPEAEIYLVGGAVRDIILKKETKDFDFVVRNLSAKKLESFLKKLGKVNLVGKSFGVFKFGPRSSKIKGIDIALPRTEHSLNLTGGYRDFKIQSNYKLPIEKDLERRDFTINALAYDIKNNNLIDKFNGLSDLAAEKIRAVGNPEKRFREDYTRILRALRFAAVLDFEIEINTWKALKKLVPRLTGKTIAREVMAREILTAFKANSIKTVDLYDASGVFKTLMPGVEDLKNIPQSEVYHSEGDVFTHSRLALERLNSPSFLKILPSIDNDLEIILGTFFHDIGKGPAIKTPKTHNVKRIRFDAHDVIGAKMTADIIDRLKLESTGEVKKRNVVWLVKRHMLLIVDDPYKFKANTIEKLFFNPRVPGQKLLSVILADALASIPKSGKPDLKGIIKMIKRISEMRKMDKKKRSLPKPLISGHDIIKELKIKQGPDIGEFLSIVREKQLMSEIKNKEEAFELLKNYIYAKKYTRQRKKRKR